MPPETLLLGTRVVFVSSTAVTLQGEASLILLRQLPSLYDLAG